MEFVHRIRQIGGSSGHVRTSTNCLCRKYFLQDLQGVVEDGFITLLIEQIKSSNYDLLVVVDINSKICPIQFHRRGPNGLNFRSNDTRSKYDTTG